MLYKNIYIGDYPGRESKLGSNLLVLKQRTPLRELTTVLSRPIAGGEGG